MDTDKKSSLALHLVFFTILIHYCIGTKYLLTVPKEPTYDTNLRVTVTALTAPRKAEEVYLEFRGLKDRSRTLNSTTLTFDQAGTQSWTVVFPWEQMLELEESGVSLTMQTGNSDTQKLELKFRESSGYIFIQTDKPIYTPRQTVKFRIIAVDEYQKLAKYPVKVDIKNPHGIIVERMRYSADDAFKGQEFELPKETSPGSWNISANFEGLGHSYSAAYSVSFEVREYVLPRFSARFSIDTDVITMDTGWIRMNVTAKYVYGRPVIGTVTMSLGTWDVDNSIVMLQGAYYRGELIDGVFKQDVFRTSLFPNNISLHGRQRLYVQVNVTESGTRETITIEDTSTFISHPYYEVDFRPSKHFFKPGFPYTIQIHVTAKSGRPASWLYVLLRPSYFDQEGKLLVDLSRKEYVYKLDMYGRLQKELDIPDGAQTVSFSIKVIDFDKVKFNEYIFNATKQLSASNEYLHISLITPVQSNDINMQSSDQRLRPGVIELKYTKPSRQDEKITLMVLAKGYVIHTEVNIIRNLDGVSRVLLPTSLLGEVSPNMRIMAYYQGLQDIVMDSLLVEAPVKYCYEELSLHKPGMGRSSPLKPKDKFSLNIRGGNKMRVGFVAVDKAVLLLNDKQTLTRKLLFSELEKHDQGTDGAADSDYKDILKSTGLQYLLLDTSQLFFDPETSSVIEGDGTDGIFEVLRPSSPEGVPPQTIRSYFPESWMFEEHVLPRNGNLNLNWALPDSITTWSVLAVGLSSNRGVCVSEPLEQEVLKMFFADVRMPYKATRLEEVKVTIAVYNYQPNAIAVQGTVTSEAGLCISSATSPTFNSGTSQKSLNFALNISALSTGTEIIKVIPLKVGELSLTVHVKTNIDEDIVKRNLYVVSEGLRVRKTITFVLDPEAKHSTFHSRFQSTTIQNHIDKEKKQQRTTIDLALPNDVIKGTEFCGISAFGDLMGDVITHAIVKSKNLIDQALVNAEEVLGDLGPAVYALQYVNDIKLLDDELKSKGQRFLVQGVTRLLKYKNGFAFSLYPESKPATWLTVAALKILCHATKLTYIDKTNLIDTGFQWLMSQIEDDGSLNEQDWRLHQESKQYKILLAADVLIALYECNKTDQIDDLNLIAKVAVYIQDNLKGINTSLTLAKAAYALKLFDSELEETERAINMLNDFKKRDKLNRFYWSDSVIDNQPKQPFWYHQVPTAAAIEATSYALLVFLNHGLINEDAIADWLVAQRNPSGAFIGAMDSTVAIQALTKYSQKKAGHDAISLHGNISLDRAHRHLHTFKFTEKNATSPAWVKDVPIGQTLEVFTEGQGLGQMQVNVEYNIPIEKNLNCHYNVTVTIKPTEIRWNYPSSNPLCQSCDIGCPESMTLRNAVGSRSLRIKARRPAKPATANERVKKDTTNTRSQNVASKRSYCIHVCLSYLKAGGNDQINLKVDMLTGFKPVATDLAMIRALPNVLHVEYQDGPQALRVQFDKVDTAQPSCFGFRVIDEDEVERHVPAAVVIHQVGNPAPSCTLDYHPPASQESLRVFCADFTHINRGECRCFSGLCSNCLPRYRDEFGLDETKTLACKRKIAYQIRLTDVKDKIHWMEIDAEIVTLNKTGGHTLQAGSSITMMSPSFCTCLVNNYEDEDFYFLSSDVERLVNRRGDVVYRYLLDENADFLHVTSPGQVTATGPVPAVPFEYLRQALSDRNICPA